MILAEGKRIAMVPPPKPHGYLSVEQTVKEELFEEHLTELTSKGVKVWDNPIESYEEDQGTHPSLAQSLVLCKYISEKAGKELGVPILMPSADDDVLVLPNKYSHIRSLYKFGCAACSSRVRNKWYHLCDICKSNASSDSSIQEKVQWFKKRVDELEPSIAEPINISNDSAVELKCDACGIVFEDLKDLKAHFNKEHPDIPDIRFKRVISINTSKSNADGKEKRGRRQKNDPSKSL